MSYLYVIIKRVRKLQISRLFEIVYILLENKTVTAKELAKRFEVSERTIYRDIDVLSSSNIPIYTNKGKGGGISLLDNFVLDKSILSEKEQNEILFALQSLERLNSKSEKTVLEKMSMLFKKKSDNWIEIDFSNWGQDKEPNERFNTIKKAILDRQVIEFTYYNSYGEESIRKVEPLQICFKDKAWYMQAFCRLKNDYRVFKLSRIKNIKLIDEHFIREIPLKIEEKQDLKIIKLKLKINKNQSFRVYDEFENKNITKDKNGDFIIEIEYPENDWVYDYILSYGENIEVISPEYAKEILKEKVEKLYKIYF